MKRKEGEEGPKRRGGNRKKTKQDTSDEEDDCAAVNCLRPNGRNISFQRNISAQLLFLHMCILYISFFFDFVRVR